MSSSSHLKRKLQKEILYRQWQRRFGQPEVFFGKSYFVDATNGSNDYDGLSMDQAKATIAAAITASNADIVLTANHTNKIFITGDNYAEDITTGATQCDLIGIDMNRSGWRPRITGLINVTCKGMRLFNLQIQEDTSESVKIGAGSHNFEMHNCEIRAAGGTHGFYMNGGSYYVKIQNCRFTAQHNYGIYVNGTSKALQILGNWINAVTCGIYVAKEFYTDFDSLIKDNIITRSGSAGFLAKGIHFAADDRVPDIMVCHNWIAATDAIDFDYTGSTWDEMNSIDNHTVTSGSGTGAIETTSS